MTVVGVTTVFLALSLLLGVVTLMAKLVAALGSSTAAGAPHGSGSSTASPGSPGEQGEKAEQADLERIAVAAYALHRASRVSVRGPALLL